MHSSSTVFIKNNYELVGYKLHTIYQGKQASIK
jgi:hypothetical protein